MKTLNIYILSFPNVMPSASYGVKDLFHIANQHAETTLFSVFDIEVSQDNSPDKQGVLFIPPSLSSALSSYDDPNIISLIKQWHNAGAVIVSACASVFWLASAGLLDNKYATTHWRLCDRLSQEYPAIKKVCPHEMVVDQGNIVTAAGLYAYQDLALHLMVRFAGYQLAKYVSDFCLLDLHGRLQAYYQRFSPSFTHNDAVVVKAQEFCAKRVAEKLTYNDIKPNDMTIADIANHCCLSERSLQRRFKQATGYTPKQYLIQLKMEKAKQLIEHENLSMEAVGYQVGYADLSNFTKVFKKVSGVTPAEFKLRTYGSS